MSNIVHCGRTGNLLNGYPIHYHKLWELCYYCEGSGTLVYGDGQSCSFASGNYVLLPPYLYHGEADVTKDFSTATILYSYDVLYPDNVDRPIMVQDRDGIVLHLLDLMRQEFNDNSSASSRICDGYLELINQYTYAFTRKKDDLNDIRYLNIEHFVAELSQHYADASFTVADALKVVPYSSEYFRKLFSSKMGKSPSVYLLEMRLNNAKNYIENSSLNIKLIAEMSGFSDQYYFSRVFKKYYHCSPRQWRITAQLANASPVAQDDDSRDYRAKYYSFD